MTSGFSTAFLIFPVSSDSVVASETEFAFRSVTVVCSVVTADWFSVTAWCSPSAAACALAAAACASAAVCCACFSCASLAARSDFKPLIWPSRSWRRLWICSSTVGPLGFSALWTGCFFAGGVACAYAYEATAQAARITKAADLNLAFIGPLFFSKSLPVECTPGRPTSLDHERHGPASTQPITNVMSRRIIPRCGQTCSLRDLPECGVFAWLVPLQRFANQCE